MMALTSRTIVILCVLWGLDHQGAWSQTCHLRADSFESEFCKLRQEVEVLTADDAKVANNEVEISKLWHRVQEQTKSIDATRADIADLQTNITKSISGTSTGNDLQAKMENITQDFDRKFTELSNMMMNLSAKMDDLAIKCRGCTPDIHPCKYQPCKNGGKCVELFKDYACVCAAGYSGKNCDILDHCSPNPCANNGTCVSNVIDHTCACPMPFTGRNCTIEILPCDTNPCARGKCVPNGKTDYKCMCDPGFYGDMCNSRVDPALITTLPVPSKTTLTKTSSITKASVSSLNPSTSLVNTNVTSKMSSLTSKVISSTTQTSVISSKLSTSMKSQSSTQSTGSYTTVTGSSVNNTTVAGNTSSTSSSGGSGLPVSTAYGPCTDASVCNAPSVCIPQGNSYICKCPETDVTRNDPCITPYYFEMFSICCVVDTCQPGGQPNCS